MTYPITLNVNGIAYPVDVTAHASLLSTVRDKLGLTGSKEGCDDSECGACMMLVDGRPTNACSYLAIQADGTSITTVEGLSEEGGVQCGFCTPGMLISATALLQANPSPTAEEVRIGLSGNLCRCTGYDGLVRAVLRVAQETTTA